MIFGNKEEFAISYEPCPPSYNYGEASRTAICHMIIGNNTIGRPTEECYLPTWFGAVERFKEFLENNQTSLYIDEFKDLSDREIFELIIKSNELEEDFDKDYAHIPQLDSRVWRRHFLTLDETIDAFLICYYVKDGKMSFMIERWRLRKLNQGRTNFICKMVDLNTVLQTLGQALDFLGARYPYLINWY